MSSHAKYLVHCLILYSTYGLCSAQTAATSWSESQIIERFLTQSPQARELRARIAVIEAEGRTRTAYNNPAVSYSLEGAGYNAFFEASQSLPVSGRVGYLRRAVDAAVSAADADREALLWSLRSDLRIAFFRMVAAQERVGLVSGRIKEVEELVRLLQRREEEGEGSRYDRLRAEREITELRTDLTTARSFIVAFGAQLAGFLPEGTEVRGVRGDLRTASETPGIEELVRRALSARADYRAEQRNRGRYQIEEQAARRLRIPDPQLSAGVKRADVVSGVGPNPFSNVTHTGLAFSVTVPLPILNSGRYEVARYQAEQEQADARLTLLARQIRTQAEGALAVLALRREAEAAYEREIQSASTELIRITEIAYQEGEIGILELLDAYRVNGAAKVRRLDLQAGVKEALIELERAVGEELTAKEVQP
jgi:cobalt-zinc-cadmium efflux system outer membrane protein